MVQTTGLLLRTLKSMEAVRKYPGFFVAGLLGVLGLIWWLKPHRKRSALQLADDGHGPLIYRDYWLDFQQASVPADALFQQIAGNVPDFCPSLLADFKKTRGNDRVLKVGDEYDIRIFGPWNGRVRVVEIGERSFTLATLKPHPEAGQIVFALEQRPEGHLRFSISSQARSRDAFVEIAYRFLGGNKVQEKAWQTFCERVAEEGGGEVIGEFHSETRELPEPTVQERP